jgi:DNA-binding winged helix-turn-helix (wHTH) protein/tetratricopeptide (TPR) repeat protein
MKCFDPFKLDVANQCLWRGHTRVALMPKPFAVLAYLVEHAGQLVSPTALLSAVWPDTHVQPDVLRKHIKEIRHVLRDSATNPRFIETVPKRGYRFVAPTIDAAIPPPAIASATGLVGRSAPLTTLHQHLKRAFDGERQVVFVEGEPGIGKTSVVEAFQRAVSHETVRVTWGQAVEGFGGKEPYYPVLEAVGRLGRGPDGPLVVDTLIKHAPTWLVQFPSLVPPHQRSTLRREVIGATRERMVRELCEAIEIITQTAALVIVLEDLHWVDHSTLDVLSAIARRREPARLLLIGTCRPAGVILAASPFKSLRRDLLIHRLAHEVPLERLSVTDVAAYVSAAFGAEDLAPGFVELVHHHSDGNPLFMSATLDHLVKRRVLVNDGGRWRLTEALEQIDVGVPDTLRHMLDLQLEQLTGDERRILMAASVAGERFSAWAVTTMLAGDLSEPEATCEAIADREQFVRAVGTSELPGGHPTTTFEFRHALYRDALYRRLAPTFRMTYHRRLAEGLQTLSVHDAGLATELAAHYEAARVFDRAVSCLELAADNALRRCAHHEAVASLEHARKLAHKGPHHGSRERDVALLQRLGDVHYAHGDMALAADTYEAAAHTATEGNLSVPAAQALMRVARAAIFFDIDRGIACCDRAAALASADQAVALEEKATGIALCWGLLHRGWSTEAADRAIASFHSAGPGATGLTSGERLLFANVQMFRSHYTEALADADAALGELSEADTLWEHLGALSAKSGALSFVGRCGEAYDTLITALELARKNANTPWLDILSGLLAFVHLQAFDFVGAAVVTAERMQSTATELGPRSPLQLLVARGLADLAQGRIGEAVEAFTDVCMRPLDDQPLLQWYWRIYARLGLGEAALAAGDLRRADTERVQLIDAASAVDESAIKALASEFSARLSWAQGNVDHAHAAIEVALRCLHRFEVPHAASRVHATAATVCRTTDPARAARHLERARAIVADLLKSVDGHEPLRRSLTESPVVRSMLNPDSIAQIG